MNDKKILKFLHGVVTGINTVESLLEPAVLLIFEAFQRPILLNKSKLLTNAAGYNKGRALITILRYFQILSKDAGAIPENRSTFILCVFLANPAALVFRLTC